MFVECSNCRIPVRVVDTVNHVKFPADIGVLEDVLAHRFNGVRHFCGQHVEFPATVTLTGPNGRSLCLDDQNELRIAVAMFLTVEIQDLWDTLTDDRYADLDRTARLAALTPVRLLAMAVDLSGRLRAGSPHHDKFKKLYISIVTDHLRLLAGDAAFAGELHRLLDRMRAAVPRMCLTPALLAALCDQCDDGALVGTPFDRDRLGAGFRAEFTCAVAHALARTPHPRLVHWTLLVVALWRWSRHNGIHIDDRYFLDAAALQATIPFSAMWDAAAQFWLPERIGDLAHLGEFRKLYAGLLTRAGYEEQFNEQLVGLTARLVAAKAAVDNYAELFDIATSRTRDGMDLGTVAAVFATYWAEAFPGQTQELVPYFATCVRETGAHADECRYTVGITRWLTSHGEWSLATRLMTELMSRFGASVPDLAPHERVDLWNELGNSFRFVGNGAIALDAYQRAADACTELPGADRQLRIIKLNRAIVLRDQGRLLRRRRR